MNHGKVILGMLKKNQTDTIVQSGQAIPQEMPLIVKILLAINLKTCIHHKINLGRFQILPSYPQWVEVEAADEGED